MRIPEEKTLFASDEKSAWIRKTYPVGCQSVYTAFGNDEISQHNSWKPFVGQGCQLDDGTMGVVVRVEGKDVQVKTQHDVRRTFISSIKKIPVYTNDAPAVKKQSKWLVCWKPRAQMREEYGYISLPPYQGVGSTQPEQRPEIQ